VSDAPANYVEAMLRAIVGFRLRITRLEGKWKMSQNRPEQDRSGVLEGMERENGEGHAPVAAIMTARPK
jgi:transcriptional regulator